MKSVTLSFFLLALTGCSIYSYHKNLVVPVNESCWKITCPQIKNNNILIYPNGNRDTSITYRSKKTFPNRRDILTPSNCNVVDVTTLECRYAY